MTTGMRIASLALSGWWKKKNFFSSNLSLEWRGYEKKKIFFSLAPSGFPSYFYTGIIYPNRVKLFESPLIGHAK